MLESLFEAVLTTLSQPGNGVLFLLVYFMPGSVLEAWLMSFHFILKAGVITLY